MVHLSSLQGKTFDKIYFLRDQKDLDLHSANLQMHIDQENQEVIVSTDVAARFVKLEIPGEKITFSDNFFDLLPQSSKVVSIGHLEGSQVNLKNLRYTALNGS